MTNHFKPFTKEVTQMVRSRQKTTRKKRVTQGRNQSLGRAIKIGPSTPYGYTDEYLTPFGGLLALEKLLDGLKFVSFSGSCFWSRLERLYMGATFSSKDFLCFCL